jgi:hypothetical protein
MLIIMNLRPSMNKKYKNKRLWFNNYNNSLRKEIDLILKFIIKKWMRYFNKMKN